MTMSSFAGVLALGLAASTFPSSHAAIRGKRGFRTYPGSGSAEKESGVISSGSSDGETIKFVNKASCTGEVGVKTWARASSAYIELVKEAIVHGCQGNIKKMTKTMEDKAKAYAKIAIETKVSCEVEGSGAKGCAFASGSAMAHAEAVYDVWVEAFAEANNVECGCAAGAVAVAYGTIEKWDKLFATAMGSIESKVCQSGTGSSSAEAEVECYASAIATLTAEAAAGAWLQSKENGKNTDGTCEPGDMIVNCEPDVYEKCQEDAYVKAKVAAEAMLDVDETSKDDCSFKYSEYIDDKGGSLEEKDIDGSTEVSDAEDEKIDVKCKAEAKAKALSKAVNEFVDTAIDYTVEKCKKGVESVDDIGEGVGRAFASVWVNAFVGCDVEDDGEDVAKGCAYAEGFAKAFAKGAAEAWALAESRGAFDECKCKIEGSAYSEVEAAFQADLFAEAMATAGVDLWGADGESCVTDGKVTKEIQIDCFASAVAAFWNKVHIEARLKGQCLLKDKAVCVHAKGEEEEADCYEKNKLYVSAFAEALVETDVELQEGYCTGNNEGGFYYFDGDASYKCIKGCGH